MGNQGMGVSDVAKMLGVGKSSIYDLVKRGELNHFKVGRKIRFTLEDVETYVKDSRENCKSGIAISTELQYFDFSEKAKSKSGFIICGQDLILDILSNYMRHSGVPALRAYSMYLMKISTSFKPTNSIFPRNINMCYAYFSP